MRVIVCLFSWLQEPKILHITEEELHDWMRLSPDRRHIYFFAELTTDLGDEVVQDHEDVQGPQPS